MKNFPWFYLLCVLLVIFRIPWPMNFWFGFGIFAGASFIAMKNDSLWGEYNHANGRSWSWRPYWKTNYSKKD